jgi:hypothetical protein
MKGEDPVQYAPDFLPDFISFCSHFILVLKQHRKVSSFAFGVLSAWNISSPNMPGALSISPQIFVLPLPGPGHKSLNDDSTKRESIGCIYTPLEYKQFP